MQSVESVRGLLSKVPCDFGDRHWHVNEDGLIVRRSRCFDALCTGFVAPTAGTLWPASRALSRASLPVDDKTILEVGAGTTGLPGLTFARRAKQVFLTDYEPFAVESLQVNADLVNADRRQHVHAERRDWADDWVPQCDVIIGADLLHNGNDASCTLAKFLARARPALIVLCWELRPQDFHKSSEDAFFNACNFHKLNFVDASHYLDPRDHPRFALRICE